MSSEIESSKQSYVSQQNSGGKGGLGRLVLWGLAVGAGMIFVKQLPDLQRYLKMRSM